MKLIKTEVCNELPNWATDYKLNGLVKWYEGVYSIWFPRFILRIDYAIS